MANEITAAAATGQVLYVLLRNASGQVYNTGGTAFETYASGNYLQYAITLAEQGQTGYYLGSVPAGVSAAGRYSVQAKVQAGGSPLATDTTLAAGVLRWTGSAETDVLANADKTGYTASTVQDKTGYTATVGAYASGQDPATLVLVTPANKVASDGSGRVTVGGYAGGQDPASQVLLSAANKLSTNASGQVQHDMAQAVPTSNTAQTVGDALCAARAQGFGAWRITGTALVLYAPDGVTPVRTFTLDSATNPSTRS